MPSKKSPDTRIRLAHGNGGRYMRELIDDVFVSRLSGRGLNARVDAAEIGNLGPGRWMLTTDGFTVDPLEFPGGNIGSLAVHGTINDLAVAGAQPRYLTLNAFLEEGTSMRQLERIVDALASAAEQADVEVVAGDTKVLAQGQCGGVFLATTGLGVRRGDLGLGTAQIRPGDRILVSGPVGQHGTAILLAREEFGLHGELTSDSASVWPVAESLMKYSGLRFMRDPTRGGLATVLLDLARETGWRITVDENQIPLSEAVAAVCELLGFDPWYLACEGRVVAVIDPDQAEAAVCSLRESGVAPEAALIGSVAAVARPGVVVQTGLGGERLIDELEDDPLPRIC